MKLYTSPGACSTADHIALQWTGGRFEAQVVSREQRQSSDYLPLSRLSMNPQAFE